MSFGFSVGDFIAALELVGTVIQSLREAGGAKSEFHELVQQLYGLETALLRVKQLEFDRDQETDYLALKQVASQCQFTIDAFWKKASRFQRDLLSDGMTVKNAWMKIRWALCKKEDLVKFKADLAAHTGSILLLLVTVQMKQDHRQKAESEAHFAELGRTVQGAARQCYEKLVNMSAVLGSSVVQGSSILQSTTRILCTNLQIFQIVCAIRDLVTEMPKQIEREQPVYMIDALGKVSPFHLEFVRSAEALKAVLQSNFESIPSGQRKIHNGEFVIQDAANGRLIDLSKDWAACFAPGQRVDMRMVFQRTIRKRNRCPSCQTPHRVQHGSDIQCQRCGLTFYHIVKTKDAADAPSADATKVAVKHLALMAAGNRTSSASTADPLPPKTAFDEVEHVRFYRRIHLLEHRRRKTWRDDASLGHVDRESLEPEKVDIGTASAGNVDDVWKPDEPLRDIVDPNVLEHFVEMCEYNDDDDEIDLEFAREVYFGSLAGICDALEQVKKSLQLEDFDMASHHAHYMRGSSSGLGLTQLFETADKIQQYDYGNLHLENHHPTPMELCEEFERDLKYILEKMGLYFRVDPDVELMKNGFGD